MTAIKQRFEDGPNRVFSGGPLISGPLYEGAEPDWEFVNTIDTVELQLLNPFVPADLDCFRTRQVICLVRIHEFTGWPILENLAAQAEADGRALLRIDGVRYERNLRRLTDDRAFEELSDVVSENIHPALPETQSIGGMSGSSAKPKTPMIDPIKKGT